MQFVNEWTNLQLKDICKKNPAYKKLIAGFVLSGKEMNENIFKIFSLARKGSEAKVLNFLLRCVANHQSLLVGMLNSLLFQNQYLISGFVLLKHNFECISVIHKVVSEIKSNIDWDRIEGNHYYNVKSIEKYLDDLPNTDRRKKYIGEFKKLGKQKSIIRYIRDMDKDYPDFYEKYSVINALSHPNHYTIIEERFPFIKIPKIECLLKEAKYLQDILKKDFNLLIKEFEK